MSEPRVLVVGAHPDDCDIKAGGTAALWKRHGIAVTFVSMTDGSAGHHEMSGPELAERRRKEATAAGLVAGVEYRVLDNPDGGLLPTLERRLEVVRLIRETEPDLVLTHRPNDYHPDHRYTSQLIQDAAYMVTVPPVAPDVPFLRKNPVFGYLSDQFSKPCPFTPEVIVPIDDVFEIVVDMLNCHVSQVHEWLPFNQGILDQVPSDLSERRAFVRKWFSDIFALPAKRYAKELKQIYGGKKAKSIQWIEAFEISEYGSPMTEELLQRLFPFIDED
ncbi:Mycothiol S-conjugate amidase [Planctomycetes bacterium Pan216]|uniref:Mycothiol S-conjugate amidase n=1 Tax=Kolteria novifilia TaxID=2527975 RepID=A0A518B2E4_9BACT|nr:Mycothiol S-conjugate amidase [Planctomycetes bacterium Pan216]